MIAASSRMIAASSRTTAASSRIEWAYLTGRVWQQCCTWMNSPLEVRDGLRSIAPSGFCKIRSRAASRRSSLARSALLVRHLRGRRRRARQWRLARERCSRRGYASRASLDAPLSSKGGDGRPAGRRAGVGVFALAGGSSALSNTVHGTVTSPPEHPRQALGASTGSRPTCRDALPVEAKPKRSR
jgi:hypothetical protein